MFPALTQNKKIIVIVSVLMISVMLTERRAEKYGDMLQYILPTLAGACALANGNFSDFATRFVALELAIHVPKNTLGEIELNLRPSGNTGGFPSGHTASASFGATSLIFNCVESNIWVKSTLVLAAAFTGSSRIVAEKHNIWQVLAGWIIGFLIDRLWRKGRGPYPFVISCSKKVASHVKRAFLFLKTTISNQIENRK